MKENPVFEPAQQSAAKSEAVPGHADPTAAKAGQDAAPKAAAGPAAEAAPTPAHKYSGATAEVGEDVRRGTKSKVGAGA